MSFTRPPGENVVDAPDAGPCAEPIVVKPPNGDDAVPVVHGAPITVFMPPLPTVAALTDDPNGESGTTRLATADVQGAKRQTLRVPANGMVPPSGPPLRSKAPAGLC